MDATEFVQNINLLEGLPNLDNLQPNANPAQNLPNVGVSPEFVNAAMTQPVEINQALTTPPANKTDTPQSDANFKLFRDNYPIMSPREYQARKGIYATKVGWQQNQEEIDYLNKLNPQTEDQKKLIQARIDTLRAGQKDYADAATVLRNTAGVMGWNMTGLGADDSFDKATQLLALDQARGTAELMDMPSTVAQKRKIYDQMLERGVAPHMARAVAESYHDEYREENIRRLNEGIMAYGLNPDGSLNDFGGMLARKLAYEDPTGAQHIVTSYAAPKDLFTHNAAMAQANLNAKSALDRELERIKSAQAIAGAKLLQDQKQHEDKMQIESDKNAIEKYKAETKFQIDIANLQTKDPRYQMGQLYDLGLTIYNGDKTKAMDFALRKFGAGEKPLASRGVMNIYQAILNDLQAGKDEDAVSKFNQINQKRDDDILKFYDGWQEDETNIESEFKEAMEEYFTTPMNYTSEEELQAHRNQALNRLFKRLSLIGTGISIEEKELAEKNARGAKRHNRYNETNKTPPPDDDTTTTESKADKNVRDILNDGNGKTDTDNESLWDKIQRYRYGRWG